MNRSIASPPRGASTNVTRIWSLAAWGPTVGAAPGLPALPGRGTEPGSAAATGANKTPRANTDRMATDARDARAAWALLLCRHDALRNITSSWTGAPPEPDR